MQVPPELRDAIDELLHGSSLNQIREDFTALSDRYRAKHNKRDSAIVQDAQDVEAYVATRLPSIYVVARVIFEELRERWPQFQPEKLLDIGAGPGTILWSAQSSFGAFLDSALLLDSNSYFRDAGRTLAKHGVSKVFDKLDWASWNAERLEEELSAHQFDLVSASYVLGELSAVGQANLLSRAWTATGGCLVLIEPGTPRGFERIAKARAQLIELGAHIFAPCAGEGACPMVGMGENKWCHFAARVERIKSQRQGKGADLAFEDEKYSYVVACRDVPPHFRGRVVDTPAVTKFDATINLCNDDTRLETNRVLKRDGDKYKHYKRLEWGSYIE